MENASKALIIAGAILLSIAIIGVGMFVYNSVSETITGAADMSKDEINTYNQTFANYEGVKNGSQVKQLCDQIRTHNNGTQDDPSLLITLVEGTAVDAEGPSAIGATGTTTAEINAIRNKILSGRQYTVSLGYDSVGRITQVGVQLNSSGTGA